MEEDLVRVNVSVRDNVRHRKMSVLCKDQAEEDLVGDASVEPVKAGDDVRHVQERSPVLHHLQRKVFGNDAGVDLVEYVIPEEISKVSKKIQNLQKKNFDPKGGPFGSKKMNFFEKNFIV